jgi:deoxyribose-phosphate aldolase
MTDLASFLDATLLDGTADPQQVREFALDAQRAGCAAVCVHAAHLEAIVDLGIPVAVVVAFPHGADTASAKIAATADAVAAGAAEIDVVMRLDALLAGDRAAALHDLKAVVGAAGAHPVKAIVETGVLTDRALVLACEVVSAAGAAFAKTSTGRGPRGASVQDVRRMRELLPQAVAIKAAGGIRTREFAEQLIAAGATRLGVSSWRAVVEGDGEGEGEGAPSAASAGADAY